MFNTGGFDVIFEISKMVLQQAIYTAPVETGPNNVVLQTFTPPFELSRTGMVGENTVNLNFLIEAVTLKAQPGSSGVTLELDFDKSSIQGPGGIISMLAGTITVQGKISATQPDDPQFDPLQKGTSFIAVDFSQPMVAITFDQPSQQRIVNALGQFNANALTAGLQQVLFKDFQSRGLSPSSFGLHIVSSGSSQSPNELVAVPTISWIDADTLGVFGYYRQGSSGGNVNLKTDSDLDATDFLSIAVLISNDGFRAAIVDPMVISMAKDRVAGSIRPGLIERERARDYNTGPATPSENTAADNDVTAFLLSPQGIAATAQNTPPPWGNGQFTDPIKMPDPFSDTTANTFWLDLALGNGTIDISTKSTASVFCGSAEVDQHLTLDLSVDRWSRIVPAIHHDPNPSVNVSSDLACDIAMAALTSFFLGPFVGVILTYIGIRIAESVTEGFISNKVQGQSFQPGNLNTPLIPGVTWNGISITPQAMRISGVADWQGSSKGAYFLPGATINAIEQPPVESVTPEPISGVYHFPGESLPQCSKQDFLYVENWFDTSWKLSITIRDVALPVTVGPWFATFGHASGVDPRPMWTGSPTQITAGTLVFNDYTSFQVPPPGGSVARQPRIELQVTGDEQNGWALKGRGQDGRYFLLVETVVTDASNTAYPVQEVIFFFGEEVDWGLDYYQAMAACAQSARVHIPLSMSVAQLQPWLWGESLANRIAEVINQAVRLETGGAQAALHQQISAHGKEFTRRVFESYIASVTPTVGKLTVHTDPATALVGKQQFDDAQPGSLWR